jgi:hypothetical protein
VVITFDGNTSGDLHQSISYYERNGIRRVLYIASSQLDGKGTLSSAQVKEMVAAGWEVGSKGMMALI